MTTETIPGTKAVAQRIDNAFTHFTELCSDRGFTADEAATILAVYRKLRIVKLNVASGRFDFRHGAFVDTEVMRNALKVKE
jgi:hypothetical protein